MPRQDFDEELDESADDVEVVDESERIARFEAENEALLEAHEAENTLPWMVFDLLFRPRLAALRWTQDADDRLRDRSAAVAAFATLAGVLTLAASSRIPEPWGERIGFILGAFGAFLGLCVFLAGSARVYDAIGRGLGAAENYDRLRVVLAMMFVPTLLVVIPVQILRLTFGDDTEITHDHALMPAGLGWLFLAANVVWLIYFPCGALQAVQLMPLRKAIGNHLAGLFCTALFWTVVGVIVYFAVRLFYWAFNLGKLEIF